MPAPRLEAAFGLTQPRAAATLVPIVEVNGEAGVIVTQRPATMVHHRGDWVFPGGRVEASIDATATDAARREAEEELGIPGSRIEMVGQLDTQGPIVTGFVIEVFVGVITGMVDLVPMTREVSAIVAVPLSHFMADANFSIDRPAPRHDPGPRADDGPPAKIGRSDVRSLASFVLPNGDLLWGTQGLILRNLLDNLAAERTRARTDP